VCTYRAALKSRDGRDKGKKRSTPSSAGPGSGVGSQWNAAELKAAEREAKAEIDELRQGRAQLALQRQGNNAGLEEDEAVQLAMLLSMEQEPDIYSTGAGREMLDGLHTGISASRLADEYDAYERGYDEEGEYDEEYSYEYEDSYEVATPTRLSNQTSSERMRRIGGSDEREDEEFDGMSDGEIEAIKAVREFEKSQG
jgi:hypothetical protein